MVRWKLCEMRSFRYPHHPARNPYQVYERHHGSQRCNYGAPARQDRNDATIASKSIAEPKDAPKTIKPGAFNLATLSTQREYTYTKHDELPMERGLLQKKIEELEQRPPALYRRGFRVGELARDTVHLTTCVWLTPAQRLLVVRAQRK